MGPRSIDRGNCRSLNDVYFSLCVLQWGRDLLIAETFATMKSHLSGMSASMGPRSIDRGNLTPQFTHTGSALRLQWGRDH